MTVPDPTPATDAANTARVAPTSVLGAAVLDNFITEIIERDLASGKYPQVITRFPPEPNGYLHLGHTFASFLDFQTAVQYGGRYHLRLDDTNPEGESEEFAQGIQDDLAWMGWQWGEHLYYASDNFERYYDYAVKLIRMGKAYVDSVSGDEMARLRGTTSEAGTPSQFRERPVEENLDLFARMRAGEFPEGAHVLRAKIDLANANMKLRDPVLYRILRADHYRAGSAWCIYPMYDFQHPLQDALEGVTHSMCSLEFIDNRAIYDWLMDTLGFSPRPHQYEFGRRSLEYTIVSKRKLRLLVNEGHVAGWDDPRMPTLRAQRRLGVTPEAVRAFAAQIGVSRTNRTVDLAVYENAVRGDLNHRAPRVMAVLEPLPVTLSGLDAGRVLSIPYYPHDVVQASEDGLVPLPDGRRVAPEQAVRDVPLSAELYIEQDDFRAVPPKGFKRLIPGGTVRLRGAGIIRADRFDVDADGNVTRVYATLLGDEAKAGGVIHWVSAAHALPAEFRLYDRLFSVPNPERTEAADEDAPELEEDAAPVDAAFLRHLNPNSLKITQGFVEGSVAADPAETRYQFERQGYFWRDPVDSRPDALVFGRIITLKDAWAAQSSEAAKLETRRSTKGEAKAAPQPTTHSPHPTSLSPEQTAEVARLTAQGVAEADARTLARDPELLAFIRTAPTDGTLAQVASWTVNDLSAAIREGRARVQAADLAPLAALLAAGTVTSRIARDTLARAAESGEAPAAIIEREGLSARLDPAELARVIAETVAANPDKVQAYRGGKVGLMGFFTGQVMRATGGKADPSAVAEGLKAALEA